ncbi:MAG: amidohydrolase family protein [Acidobacteria bacterium]|nr:amidohydrolase family protein [Acidobacteriota bacterium]
MNAIHARSQLRYWPTGRTLLYRSARLRMGPSMRSNMAVRWLLSLCVAVSMSTTQLQAQSLLIRGGTLIDGSGGAPIPDAQILIRDGLIADIARQAPTAAPSGAEVIDARGKFIVPGLIDSHVHYREWHGEVFLAYGVTSVYDVGDPYYWQAALKQGFNSGRMRGPRYFFCGEIRLPSEEAAANALPAVARRGLEVIRKREEADGIVRRLKEAGVDCLKLSEQFSGDLFAAIARAARSAGLRVISHSLNVSDSIRRGIGGVEHMEGIAIASATSPRGRQAVDKMPIEAGHKNSALYHWMEPEEFDRLIKELVGQGVFVNPTLDFEWKALTDRTRDHEREDLRLFHTPSLAYVPVDERLVVLGQYHWPDSRSAEIHQFKEGYRKVQQFLAKFVQSGGKIYSGTDSSAATTPGLSLHHELELLVDAGLTPMQAIMTATKHAADLLGLDAKMGTIEKGKVADLVLLEADPLTDIRNTKRIATVIKDGRILDTTFHANYEMPIRRPGPESKHLYNPIPVVRDVVPPVAVEGRSAPVRVLGRGFTSSSVVRFAGRTLDTRWVSSTELAVILTPEQTARVGTFLITVETPKPGGGHHTPWSSSSPSNRDHHEATTRRGAAPPGSHACPRSDRASGGPLRSEGRGAPGCGSQLFSDASSGVRPTGLGSAGWRPVGQGARGRRAGWRVRSQKIGDDLIQRAGIRSQVGSGALQVLRSRLGHHGAASHSQQTRSGFADARHHQRWLGQLVRVLPGPAEPRRAWTVSRATPPGHPDHHSRQPHQWRMDRTHIRASRAGLRPRPQVFRGRNTSSERGLYLPPRGGGRAPASRTKDPRASAHSRTLDGRRDSVSAEGVVSQEPPQRPIDWMGHGWAGVDHPGHRPGAGRAPGSSHPVRPVSSRRASARAGRRGLCVLGVHRTAEPAERRLATRGCHSLVCSGGSAAPSIQTGPAGHGASRHGGTSGAPGEGDSRNTDRQRLWGQRQRGDRRLVFNHDPAVERLPEDGLGGGTAR